MKRFAIGFPATIDANQQPVGPEFDPNLITKFVHAENIHEAQRFAFRFARGAKHTVCEDVERGPRKK